MTSLIASIIVVALISSPEWVIIREISPDGPGTHAWALETQSGNRWIPKGEGGLVWECSAPDARDSLLLGWSVDEVGRGAALHAVVEIHAPPGHAAFEIAAVLRDGTARVLLPHTTVAGAPRLDSRAESRDTVIVRAPVPDGSNQILIRVGTDGRFAAGAVLCVSSLVVEGRRGPVSLIPRPTVVLGEHPGTDGVRFWRLPVVPEGSWRMDIDSLTVPTGWVAEVEFLFVSPAQPLRRPRLVWWEHGTDRTHEARIRLVPGHPDTAMAMVEPDAPAADSSHLCLEVDAGSGGAGVGPLTVRARPKSPLPGDVALVRIACAPADAERIEIANHRWWPVPTAGLTIDIDGRMLRCGDESIPGHSSFFIQRSTCPGLVVPNERGTITLLYEGREIDRVAYGPEHQLPAPPRGWALRLDSIWKMERAPEMSIDACPGMAAAGEESLAFSEILLWPLDSSDRFVEIVNRGSTAADLSMWSVICEDAFVFPESTMVQPSEAWVAGSALFPRWFALNPQEGEAVLVDPRGRIIDRVRWDAPPPNGQSLSRVVAHRSQDGEWSATLPSPGIAGFEASDLFQVEITATPEGRCIQWNYPREDHLLFWVYRAPLHEPDSRTRVTAEPIGGSPPHTMVDIDASPDQDYVYWIGMVDASGEVLVGPISSIAAALNLSVGPPSPNPFRAETSVPYSIRGLARAASTLQDQELGNRLHVGVYTMGGSLVRTLVSDQPREGAFVAVWDGRDEAGRISPPAVYVVSVQVGPWVRSSRVVYAGQ